MTEDAQTQLTALQTNNAADATALTALEADLNDTTPSASDTVVAALVSALEAAGYTVTAPVAAAPADAPELPATTEPETP
jgi:hypothetical protein